MVEYGVEVFDYNKLVHTDSCESQQDWIRAPSFTDYISVESSSAKSIYVLNWWSALLIAEQLQT